MPPIFRNGALWIGFGVPAIVCSLQAINAYEPSFPAFRPVLPIGLFGPYVSFSALGFFFLVQREVLFGLWVFALLGDLQAYIYDVTGWGTEQAPAVTAWSYGHASVVHQSMGAMIVLVLGGLWVGREHIRSVLRKAVSADGDVRDDDEIISYRGAVIGLVLSVVVMMYWLLEVGLPPTGAAILLFFTFVIYLTLTRLVAEGGVGVIYTPMVAPDAAISAMGAGFYSMRGLVGLSFSRVFANDLLNFTMPHMAHGLKLSTQMEGNRRMLFWAMLAAVLLGLAAIMWVFMDLAYTYGANNLSSLIFFWMPNYVFDYAIRISEEQPGPDWLGWMHAGVGGSAMVLLLMARRYLAWWPLNPIAFPISSTLEWIALNAFLAWAIKCPVLRFGGVALYRRVRPFFFGLILGHFVTHVVWWIIDLCTGVTGNLLWP